jgi:transcriptional regulator of acetoin/glycerol metabolism
MDALRTTVPGSIAEWDAIRAAKLEVLERDPFSIRDGDYPQVRPDVLRSWKRSLLAGVDPHGTVIPHDPGFVAQSRLAQIAQPIMNRLEDQISDLSSWGFLTDRASRLLTVVVGDSPQAERLRQKDLRPGLCFAEDQIGTNGIGCAQEEQRPFIISGSEHFRLDTEIITTTGVNIRDPYTKRFVGTLGVHCRREYGSTALLQLVVEIGRSIEAQLLASRADEERVFFDHYLRKKRRFRGAIVGITKNHYVANAQAQALLSENDQQVLRRLAEETSLRGQERSTRRRLANGSGATITITPLDHSAGRFAAVLTLEPEREPAPTSLYALPFSAGGAVREDFRAQARRALGGGQAVLFSGERGSGKRHIARDALAELCAPAAVAEIDGAQAHAAPGEWFAELSRALRDGSAPVLLTHLEEIPAELVHRVADLISSAAGPLVGTTTELHGEDSPTVFLRECFPAALEIPPLRNRADEFSALCRGLLAALDAADGQRSSIAPKAVAALVSNDWPGNVRQLRQVLATSRIRAAGREIRLTDLPARYGTAAASRPLREMERVERQTLMVALRESGGNREVAAEKLGISRATIYRKLKRYELR